ncbi:hypothetical protein OROMI_016465 [Orobanche minor]
MGSQHTTARLDSAILGSGDGCSGHGGSIGAFNLGLSVHCFRFI